MKYLKAVVVIASLLILSRIIVDVISLMLVNEMFKVVVGAFVIAVITLVTIIIEGF